MRRRRRGAHLAVAAAATVLAGVLASQAAPMAQRGGGAAGPVLIPATASSVVRNPDPFLGHAVSLVASLDRMLSATVFTVDQDRTRSTGQDVLVVAPTLQRAVDPGTYLTVQGRVLSFDPDEIRRLASAYSLDLAPDLIERYRGRPAILATVVLTPDLEDLAKVPPPPVTPAEEAFDGVMKQVGAANGTLRSGIQAANAGQVKDPLITLKTAFAEAEAFFGDRGGADDAVEWARQARQAVEAIERAVSAGNWEEAGTASASLAQKCSTCHGAYRIQLDDGSYRVRWPGGGW